MSQDRHAALQAFVRTTLGAQAGAPLAASSDASFRRYWRVQEQGRSWIIMDAPPALEDCRPFIDVAARLLAAGLNVPQVHAQDLAQGFLLLDDLGQHTLLSQLDAANVDAEYERAMRALLQMQTAVDTQGLPRYDERRLGDELDLLERWFLREHLGVVPSCDQHDVMEAAFRLLIDNALQQPQVFVHRDFHSRNLMLAASPQAAHGILDFQDAVLGPISYDLVSLLKDCYCRWPPDQVAAWAEGHRQRLLDSGLRLPPAALWQRWFDRMGLQRHLKVLGIFARLWHRDGKAAYLADLPRVLDYALEACDRDLPLQPLGALLRRWTAGIDLTRPTS